MRIVCVDDEKLVLDFICYICKQLPEIEDVIGSKNRLQ